MRRALTRGLLWLPLVAASAVACGLLFPFTPGTLADTRVQAICHVLYSCCTPAERSVTFGFAGLDGFADEASCVREFKENPDLGQLYLIDKVAQDSIGAGKAEYDGEAAERCARPLLDAVNACDATAYITPDGRLNLSATLLAPSNDSECQELISRAFTRGKVKDGGECTNDIDCADFGECGIADNNDGSATVVTATGKCVAPLKEGEACGVDDEKQCGPGLSCISDGSAATCKKPPRKGTGDPCEDGIECESGLCEQSANVAGVCVFSGEPCEFDGDCDEQNGEFCQFASSRSCAAAGSVKREICDGT